MSVRKRLQRWWDEWLGRPRWYRDADGGTTHSGLKPVRPRSTAAGPLALADDPAPPQAPRRARRARSAGMDPYANDAGYAKPHSWERVDHD